MDLVANFRARAQKIVSLSEYTAKGEAMVQSGLNPAELIQRELAKSKTSELSLRANSDIESDPIKLAYMRSNAYVSSDGNLRMAMGVFVTGEFLASTISHVSELETEEDKIDTELQDKMNAIALETFSSCKDYGAEVKSGMLVPVCSLI